MRKTLRVGLALAALAVVACGAGAPQAFAGGRMASVSGSVLDSKGNPIAGAVVSVIKDGADVVIKQVKSAADGSFLAKIAPGRYSLRAVAAGFNAVLFDAVQVQPADQVVYRFRLEPVGSGRTAPERRKDRDDRKWMLRSRAGNRSIFQAGEGEDSTVNAVLAAQGDLEAAAGEPYEVVRTSGEEEEGAGATPRTQGVVETYFASSNGTHSYDFAGVNFAVARPLGGRVDLIFAGQTGVGPGAPQRLEITASVRANDAHRLRLTAAGGLLNGYNPSHESRKAGPLGQLSLRAVDEWVVRDGIVVVLGLDYSRFLGAGGAQVISPRLGVQFDADSKTRLRAAYAPSTDWAAAAQSIAEFEDTRVIFREPVSTPVAYVDGRAVMERSHRLEFGVERVLDNESSIEATAFFDTTSNRGVGVFAAPLSAFAGEAGAPLMSVANQEGAARGVRVVYARRISSVLNAAAGYSFGRGQQLSAGGLNSPADFFEDGFFQTAAIEMSAHLDTGTRVRTVFRFSPRATVFAIDPFAGRLAVYDPSLSILITQELPNFGLPVRAEAVIDARNLLDAQATAEDGEKFTSVDAGRRSVRGGISVRF